VLLPEAEEMLDQLCRVKTGMHAIHWIDRFCEVAKVWPAFPKSGLVKIATLEASGLLTIRLTKLSFNGGTFPWTSGKRNIYIYVRRCRKLGVHRFRNLEVDARDRIRGEAECRQKQIDAGFGIPI